MKHFELIEILADGKFYSGEILGQRLGISRSAVWKLIKKLSAYQLNIQAISGRGYRLTVPIELLNHRKIINHLSADVRDGIESIIIEYALNSTNTYLQQLDTLCSPLKGQVCLAEYQTAGKGRRGRQWYSPFGCNIYLSLRWHFLSTSAYREGLSLIVGLLVIRALTSLGMSGLMLKWPNDIYWQQKKLGGILIEMSGEVDGPGLVVIGIGINFDMSLFDTLVIDQPWVDVATISQGPLPSRNQLVGILLNYLVTALQQESTLSFAHFHAEWDQHDFIKGKEISLNLGEMIISGTALNIDETGALVVSLDGIGTVRRFFSGDVSLRVKC